MEVKQILPDQQFDPVVAAIDWLDACKSRELDDVIEPLLRPISGHGVDQSFRLS